MFKIALVDDNEQYLNDAKSMIHQFFEMKNITYSLEVYHSGLSFIATYQPNYDVVFLDIEMPHMSGLEVAEFIRKSTDNTIIFFVTNMPQFATKGYEFNAFDYLIKPIVKEVLFRKLEEALRQIKSREELTIQVPSDDGGVVINAKDIVSIEVMDHWLYFTTLKGSYKMLGSLKEMEDKLQYSNFIRCNKSVLINLCYVTRMKTDFVELEGQGKIKMSRSRRKEVQEAFIDFYSEQHMM